LLSLIPLSDRGTRRRALRAHFRQPLKPYCMGAEAEVGSFRLDHQNTDVAFARVMNRLPNGFHILHRFFLLSRCPFSTILVTSSFWLSSVQSVLS
jgi:hypothetical protein